MNQQELEDRLINFSVIIIRIIELLPATKAGNHLAGQLIRSGTAPALIYGEVRAAESKKDFIHKIKLLLKELRESLIAQKIIKIANLLPNDIELLDKSLIENNELVSIFVATLKSLGGDKSNI
jgi:four helix bundle protein